nr:hypothetical protein [Tanacetum cinerariifolium]
MDQLRPFRAEQPQAAATLLAEVSLCAAGVNVMVVFVAHLRVVDRNAVFASDLETFRVATQVDRVAATALGLAADRAVATLIGVGMSARQAELDCAAMAGTFQ